MDIQLLNTLKVHVSLTFLYFPSQRYRFDLYYITHVYAAVILSVVYKHLIQKQTFEWCPKSHGRVLWTFSGSPTFIDTGTIRHLEEIDLRSLSILNAPPPPHPHDFTIIFPSCRSEFPLSSILRAITVATVHWPVISIFLSWPSIPITKWRLFFRVCGCSLQARPESSDEMKTGGLMASPCDRSHRLLVLLVQLLDTLTWLLHHWLLSGGVNNFAIWQIFDQATAGEGENQCISDNWYWPFWLFSIQLDFSSQAFLSHPDTHLIVL